MPKNESLGIANQALRNSNTNTESKAQRDPAPAVTRALRILDLLAGVPGPLTLSDIARNLEVPKSSCVNLCLALEAGGMIRKASDGYTLDRKTAELGSAYVSEFSQMREFFNLSGASPTLRTEVVQLVMLDGDQALYLARHEGKKPYRIGTPLGSRLPAVFSAAGRALLAEADEDFLNKHVLPTLPLTSPVGGKTLDMPLLRQRLNEVRENKYALDPGLSTPGVGGVAVSVSPWAPGDPTFAMGVAIPLHELTERRIAEVSTALREIAAQLENPWKVRNSRS